MNVEKAKKELDGIMFNGALTYEEEEQRNRTGEDDDGDENGDDN